MSGASERANGRASVPVLTSRFLIVPDHSALVCSHHSVIRLLRTACFACTLRCAQSFSCSLTPELVRKLIIRCWDNWMFCTILHSCCCVHFLRAHHSTMGQNQVILRRQKFTFPRVSGASERANGRASGLVLMSRFMAVLDHSALPERLAGFEMLT